MSAIESGGNADITLVRELNDPSSCPTSIGRYHVLSVLGEGAFGKVYQGRDDDLHRQVAIKVPHESRFLSPEDRDSFLAEARILASLDHPGIVPVYDIGRSESGMCYVVYKFVEGQDLAARIQATPFSWLEAAQLVAEVAESLHYAHLHGLVHRDVKPANILIDSSSRPFIADFGLAIFDNDLLSTKQLAGTPAYMSPEQVRGEGHRIDGRSDVFALGVVFYELLAGRRPFRAETHAELFEQIIAAEPRPPRQIVDVIPKELERICLTAMAKRASDRYMTARDFADDLRRYLGSVSDAERQTLDRSVRNSAKLPATSVSTAPASASDTGRTPASGTASDLAPPRIVPKGLRSFDGDDFDFFLELLQGPRHRDGLPDSIRFWRSRIDSQDEEQAIPIGLIYGPSGCGKSSLVKAGILPRLSERVVKVYIEATPEDTEARLLLALQKKRAAATEVTSLKGAISALRRGRVLPAEQKVLLVIDQFEQWLHSHSDPAGCELLDALRQCDGKRVQCVLLVRDDFWMAITRFLRELEVRLVEGGNSMSVDLFDVRHAKKVLTAFGRAYQALPEGSEPLSEAQRAFIEQAVAGLVEHGKVVCVRLALFAEMVKAKPWTPATLKKVGGAAGIRVSFLEETFDSAQAPPDHRLHQKAVRRVLKALLPELGSDLKGHRMSHDELLAASGYADRPADFADLLLILDQRLRLLTPVDPRGLADDSLDRAAGTAVCRYYQLTHDYLVPALRAWLTGKQKETRRGRTELQLAERATLWNAKPQSRHLLSLGEWLNALCLTRGDSRTPGENKLMRASAKYHALRCFLALTIALAGLAALNEWHGRVRSGALLERLRDANTVDVPQVVADLGPYRRWIDPRLRTARTEQTAATDSRSQLHRALALLPVDKSQVSYLVERLLKADIAEVVVIRQFLHEHQAVVTEPLWETLEADTQGGKRLRAACALSLYEPQSTRWKPVATAVVAELLRENPVEIAAWMEALRPAKAQFIEALMQVYRNRADERSTERNLATMILGEYVNDDPQRLSLLLVDADPQQFARIYPKLERVREQALPLLDSVCADRSGNDTNHERLARQQANAAAALFRLGQTAHVMAFLKPAPDSRVRGHLIHRLAALGVDFQFLAQRLETEPDVAVRRALLLSLSEYGDSEQASKAALIPKLRSLYHSDPDAGIHGAAAWLLQAWGGPNELSAADTERPSESGRSHRNWYVSSQGQTFSIVEGPARFYMGSPPGEGGRDDATELRHWREIRHSFAIAVRETTVHDFLQFRANHPYDPRYAPDKNCPVNMVSWYDAAAYCNWLSQREGLPRDQWCYEPNAAGDFGPAMRIKDGHLSLSGYRLPTEAEWEFACRAGATTSRSYGDSEELLARYAWYARNSLNKGMLPPGSLLPNELGLFDMLGNVQEWSHDRLRDYSPGTPGSPALLSDEEEDVQNRDLRVLRGVSFLYRADLVRCATRLRREPSSRLFDAGLRVARTHLPPKESHH